MATLPLLLLGLLLSAPPPQQVQRAAANILSAEHIQTKFPGDKQAERPPPPSHPKTEKRSPRESLTLQSILWILIAAAAILAVVYFAQRFGPADANLTLAGTASAAPAGALRPAPPLDEAERLAAEDRFEEAIHTLLLLSLHPLTEEEHLAGSLTSREILGKVSIPAAAHEAIRQLVRAVELSIFGGRPPNRADYEAAAAHYRTYSSLLGVGAAVSLASSG